MLRKRLEKIIPNDIAKKLEEVVKELVNSYRPLSIVVTGSLAKGKFVEGMSDIDLLVVLKESPGKDRFVLRAIDNVDVEITLVSLDELVEAIRRGNQFYIEAINGVEIYGNVIQQLKELVTRRTL